MYASQEVRATRHLTSDGHYPAIARKLLPCLSNFATEADGTITLPTGSYTVELTTDDGGRLSIDGKRVIDEWH
jgi:hypothetical protein